MSKLVYMTIATLIAIFTISGVLSIAEMIGVHTVKGGLVLFCIISVIAGIAIGFNLAKALER